jgi:hypothetical protein
MPHTSPPPKHSAKQGGYFFLGSLPQDGDPIRLNGSIQITCTILKLVAASAAEAELGVLFLNEQEAKIKQLILTELGHPQPPTPIHINNTTTVCIINNTVKQQQSHAMEMRNFWLLDGESQQQFKFYWQPGQENLGNNPSKHHPAEIHQHIRPFYVHMDESPTLLPRAMKSSTRQGCAESLGDPYSKKSPLPSIGNSRLSVTPRIPGYQLLGLPQLLQQHTTHNNHHRMAPQWLIILENVI